MDPTNWPSYRSTKRKRAVEILEVPRRNAIAGVTIQSVPVRVELREGPSHLEVPAETFARYWPERGDFLVAYEQDGGGWYYSVEPRGSFIGGHEAWR